MENVIEVKEIRKKYGDFTAVDGISFSVDKGEIFGIVGPNGAGKSTTIESVMGLRTPDSGSVTVLGMDPHKQREAVAQRIGIQLQQASLPDNLRVWEACDLFSSFYAKTVPWEPLLKEWGLSEKRDAPFRGLSGGQKQRLFIILALLNDPEIVFLDELTTGLDPQARRNTWELVDAIRAKGKTVVLVTHFMDEAQELCDHLAIIDSGKIIALDTVPNLIQQQASGSRVLFTANGDTPMEDLKQLPNVTEVQRKGKEVIVVGERDGLASGVLQLLDSRNVAYRNFRTEQANLEDVFLALTGREMRE